MAPEPKQNGDKLGAAAGSESTDGLGGDSFALCEDDLNIDIIEAEEGDDDGIENEDDVDDDSYISESEGRDEDDPEKAGAQSIKGTSTKKKKRQLNDQQLAFAGNEEEKRLRTLRVIVVMVILCTGAVVAALTYVLLHNLEQTDLQHSVSPKNTYKYE